MDSCCRSLLPSVDWNMACASSAKYHWEDEIHADDVKNEQKEGSRSRRSHWTEQENDTLKFAVLDSLHYSYFLNKWGLIQAQQPLVIAIDASRELFSVMEGSYSQKRVREFIHDYHSYLISDHLMSEEDSRTSIDVTRNELPYNFNFDSIPAGRNFPSKPVRYQLKAG
ncbi:hypothetical protein OSTOST_10850 [Ostertagia ostertagi]